MNIATAKEIAIAFKAYVAGIEKSGFRESTQLQNTADYLIATYVKSEEAQQVATDDWRNFLELVKEKVKELTGIIL